MSDSGPGIPEEKREMIFASFVRLHNPTAERAIEGTGLGLTISKRLADLLGGTLHVESTLGKGSTFTLLLDADVLEHGQSVQPLTASSGLGSLPPLRILLAEDNRINQMFVSMILTEAGHTVVTVPNGKEAVGGARSRNGGGLRPRADGRADAGHGRDRGDAGGSAGYRDSPPRCRSSPSPRSR